MSTTSSVPPRVRSVLVAIRWIVLAASTTVSLLLDGVEKTVPIASALSVIAVLGSVHIDVPYVARWQPVGESVLVASTLAAGGLLHPSFLPTLLVPSLAAGLLAGFVAAVLAAGLAGAILIVTAVATDLGPAILEIAQSVLLALLLGILGGWIRRLLDERPRSAEATDQASYESAYQLLTRLRVVSRRLSQGLDPASLAESTLAAAVDLLGGGRGVVVVPSAGDSLVPLATVGAGAAIPESAVREVWVSQEVHRSSLSSHGELVAIPLRAGSRSVGVVAVGSATTVDRETLREAERLAREAALRLDTALLFDEVRSLATAEERRRLAREIHDGIAQDLASLGYAVDELIEVARPEERPPLLQLRGDLGRLVTELRHSIFDLRSEVAPTGLGTAVADYVQATGSRNGALTVHLRLDESPHRLRRDVEEELLRIAQEAVTNARRHARAANLWVSCSVHPPHAELRVEDDGAGIRPGRGDSFGISVMRERADRIGADLSVGSRAEGGTVVSVRYGDAPGGGQEEGHLRDHRGAGRRP